MDQEGISQRVSEDARICRRGFLSRLEQELCRDGEVLFKGIFFGSSRSAGTSAPMPTSSAMELPSMKEMHLWDSLCPAWSQHPEGAVGVSAGAAGSSSTRAAK